MPALLVIPCYRERERLPRFLPGLCEALAAAGDPVTVLVSDDGSGAEAQAWLTAWLAGQRERWPFLAEPLLAKTNSGKGGAVYAGWAAAGPEIRHLAFVDADGAIPPEEVVRVLTLARQLPEQAVYAVRTGTEGTRVERTAGRRIAGLLFRAVVRGLFRFPVPDTQCGCKSVPRAAWDALRPSLTETRFCFDIELTHRLLAGGTGIASLPIDWTERPGSQMRPAGALGMFASVWTLHRRLRDWRTGAADRSH